MKRERKFPLSAEELERLYWEEGLSTREIAELLGISKTAVKNWMHKYGIPMRDFSSASKLAAKKLKQSEAQFEKHFLPPLQVSEDEDILDTIIKLQEDLEVKDVEDTVDISISSKRNWVLLCFLSDLHLGGELVDYKKLKQDINIISSDRDAYCMMLGDITDNFILPNKTNQGSTLLPPKVQWALAKQIAQKLSGSCLVMLIGDHEAWTVDFTGLNPIEEIAKMIGAKYLRWGGVINLNVNDIEYTIGVRHRFRYESSFNLTNAVKRFLEFGIDFDIGVIGHRHVPDIEWAIMKGKPRVFVRTGSYKVLDNFVDKYGYRGYPLSPTVLLNTSEKEILIFQDVQVAYKVWKQIK